MRITISHGKTKAEVVRAVDRSFDDIFKNLGPLPIKLTDEKRAWTGSTLTFSFNARMGLLSSLIKGTVDVTDRDVTIDADLGLLDRLLSSKSSQGAIENKVRGYLT